MADFRVRERTQVSSRCPEYNGLNRVPVPGPGGAELSRVKERVLRGVVAGWIPPTALGLAPRFLSQWEAEASQRRF